MQTNKQASEQSSKEGINNQTCKQTINRTSKQTFTLANNQACRQTNNYTITNKPAGECFSMVSVHWAASESVRSSVSEHAQRQRWRIEKERERERCTIRLIMKYVNVTTDQHPPE